MDRRIIAEYDAVYEKYRQGEFAQALEGLQRLYTKVPGWLQLSLLEAHIHRKSGAVLSEIRILQEMTERKNAMAEEASILAEAWSMLGSAYSSLGCQDEAREAFIASAGWENQLDQRRKEYSNAIFVSNYMETDLEEMEKLYGAYRKTLQNIKPYRRVFYAHRRLRAGYLSADFRCHPVAYFAAALLEQFDRDQFEVYCYAANEEDWISRRFQQSVTSWKNVKGSSLRDIAAVIREDEIDILVDLSGHTNGSLLPVLAWQPATVQLSGIGYFNGTGLKNLDGFLSDRYCAQDALAAHYFTEPLLQLPDTHFCYSLLQNMPDPVKPAFLENGYITFGCFNNFAKLTDAMLGLWLEILHKVPNARLFLKHHLFNHAEGRAFARQRLDLLGFPLDRIDFQSYTADYLSEYHKVDIALDTYPYTGGLTTFEALYMGVPVISLYGKRHGSRFGYSILQNAGIGELAVDKGELYVTKAVALAKDHSLLILLHKNLRHMVTASPLMDAEGYTKAVEDLYQKLWKNVRANHG